MKQIQLTQGKVAIVDDQDFDFLNSFKWYAWRPPQSRTYYAIRNVQCGNKRKTLRMHRYLLGAKDGVEVDHRDNDGLNNRRDNLRMADDLQNGANKQRSRHNSSGFKGVGWHKRDLVWHAYIKVNWKRLHLGYFTTAEEAARAYDAAALKHFGEFARLNFPPQAA